VAAGCSIVSREGSSAPCQSGEALAAFEIGTPEVDRLTAVWRQAVRTFVRRHAGVSWEDLGAKVSATEIRIDLSADVLFDFDKADIKKEAEPELQKVATVLNANSNGQVSIDGHTDGKGTDAYNNALSERRAAVVKTWLTAHSQMAPARIATRGLGKTKPVAHDTKPDGSDDPEGRAKNRRVEIVVRKVE
jgi:outer membrane protein OmpA-like peptidoglycan-associated protein